MKLIFTMPCLFSIGTFASDFSDQDIGATMTFSGNEASWISFSSPLYKDVDPAQKAFEALKANSSSVIKYYNGEKEITKSEYRDYVDTIEVTNGIVNCHYVHRNYYCRIWL